MGTTSEELKKLYAKLGGKDPKVAGFSAPGEILNAINEIPLPTEYELPTVTTEDAGDVLVVNDEGKWDKGEAGSGLPEVTTDDNGDILQVIEGAWAKAAMSKDVVVIECSISGNRITPSGKTVTEIINDYKTGKYIVLSLKQSENTIEYYTMFNKSDYYIGYVRPQGNGANVIVNVYIASIMNNCFIKYNASAYSLVPVVQQSDNSKILQVVNGEWTKSDPPASLPEVTAADNGDVLTVVNGAWGKASAPSGACVVYNVGNYSQNVTALNPEDSQQLVSDIQNGKIPVIVGTDGKVYNFWGKGNNPWGDSNLYCFVYLQWKWDSTNNKSYLEVYMICGLHSNRFYFSPKQTVG